MGQKDFLISSALIVIFVIAFFSFGIGFATDNDANVNIGNSDLVGDLADDAGVEAEAGFLVANASGDSFAEASIAEDNGAGTLVTGSQFKNAPKSNLKTVYNVIRNAQSVIFGEDATAGQIFTVIITLVGTISLLLIWKTWKGGNPD